MATVSIMWFRRDLRLTDLPALTAAAAGGRVVPLFVIDPAFSGTGVPRRAYMAAALRAEGFDADVSYTGTIIGRCAGSFRVDASEGYTGTYCGLPVAELRARQ